MLNSRTSASDPAEVRSPTRSTHPRTTAPQLAPIRAILPPCPTPISSTSASTPPTPSREGAIKADKIAALARDAAMPAVAMTDTANLFGGLEFSQACTKQGVQPILGCQIALARTDNPRLPPDPMVLLAQDAAGLANLQRLSSLSFLEPETGLKPQLPWARIAEHAQGLILLTGGTTGPLARLLAEGQQAGGRTPAGADRTRPSPTARCWNCTATACPWNAPSSPA